MFTLFVLTVVSLSVENHFITSLHHSMHVNQFQAKQGTPESEIEVACAFLAPT
jgi:hypothetical protein